MQAICILLLYNNYYLQLAITLIMIVFIVFIIQDCVTEFDDGRGCTDTCRLVRFCKECIIMNNYE